MSTQQTEPTNAVPNLEFLIQKIFLKDSSFECPSSPEIFKMSPSDQSPKLELDTFSESLGNDAYEVTLKITMTTHYKDKLAYLIEVLQSGIFTIKGIAGDELDLMLGTYGPATLFPYAREYLAGMLLRGGFPGIHLEPVNFEGLYLERKIRAEAMKLRAKAAH